MYVCFEYNTLPKDIQQLTYNDFGTHHADSNMHHVKIKLWHSGNIHSRFHLHFQIVVRNGIFFAGAFLQITFVLQALKIKISK